MNQGKRINNRKGQKKNEKRNKKHEGVINKEKGRVDENGTKVGVMERMKKVAKERRKEA